MVAIGEDTRHGKVDDSLAEVEVEERRSVSSDTVRLPVQLFNVQRSALSLRTFLFRLPQRDVLQW